jgi:hypothetical protein
VHCQSLRCASYIMKTQKPHFPMKNEISKTPQGEL